MKNKTFTIPNKTALTVSKVAFGLMRGIKSLKAGYLTYRNIYDPDRGDLLAVDIYLQRKPQIEENQFDERRIIDEFLRVKKAFPQVHFNLRKGTPTEENSILQIF